jgi:hypothetical protein
MKLLSQPLKIVLHFFGFEYRLDGSLNEYDITTLNTGFISILPNDNIGNFVLMLEPCKAATRSPESQRRCYFYLMFVLISDHRLNDTVKVVFLVFLNDLDDDQICTTNQTTFVDIGKVFPLDVASYHNFFEPAGLGWLAKQRHAESLLTQLLRPPVDRTENHNIEDIEGRIFSFSYNFDVKKIPIRLGGQWSSESFRIWCENRKQVEFTQMMTITTQTKNGGGTENEQPTNGAIFNVIDATNNWNHDNNSTMVKHGNCQFVTNIEMATIPFVTGEEKTKFYDCKGEPAGITLGNLTAELDCSILLDDVKQFNCSSNIADEDTFSINTQIFDDDMMDNCNNDNFTDNFSHSTITIDAPAALDMFLPTPLGSEI